SPWPLQTAVPAFTKVRLGPERKLLLVPVMESVAPGATVTVPVPPSDSMPTALQTMESVIVRSALPVMTPRLERWRLATVVFPESVTVPDDIWTTSPAAGTPVGDQRLGSFQGPLPPFQV